MNKRVRNVNKNYERRKLGFMSREERGFRKTRGVFLEGHVSIICKT